MDRKELATPRFTSANELAEEIRVWQDRYEDLIRVLGELGSGVYLSRTIEFDMDSPPYKFIRSAEHEFIFPKQDLDIVEVSSEKIDDSVEYGLDKEFMTSEYDTTKVRGHIKVKYDDSDSRIIFSIIDQMDDSNLPTDAATAIERTGLESFS